MALDFTLDVVGQDINSGPFWQDCIQLLQAPKPGTPDFMTLFPQVSGHAPAATRTHAGAHTDLHTGMDTHTDTEMGTETHTPAASVGCGSSGGVGLTPVCAAVQALPGQEEAARMAAVRRVFQRAVAVPHHHVDGIWRDYSRFENEGPNKQFAKKVSAEGVAGRPGGPLEAGLPRD